MEDRTRQIAESLKKCAPRAVEVGAGRWSFALANGKAVAVSVRADDEWLLIDAALPVSYQSADHWNLLRLNGELPGLSKFALLRGKQAPRLRAEIPLDEEVFMTDRLFEALAGFKRALSSVHAKQFEEAARNHSASTASGDASSTATNLTAFCEEAGWPFVERSAGKLAVNLETRRGFYEAMIEHIAGGQLEVRAQLASLDVSGEPSRQALGVLLLKASGEVRMIRAAVEENNRVAAARFEAKFSGPASAAELGHALSALSVACELCGDEAKAFADESLARKYLAIHRMGF